MKMNIYEKNIDIISGILKEGEKERGDLKLGVEVEHFITDTETGKTVGYGGEHGVASILRALKPLYDEPVYDNSHIIGLKRKASAISIEPAAQFEISIEPKADIKQTELEYNRFCEEVNTVIRPAGQKLTAMGYHPVSRIDELELIPKQRYRYMYDYFKEKYAHNMMKGTASVQVSLDYTSEDDFGKKIKLLSFIGLVFAFFTDNAPIFEGAPAERMIRSRIWDNTDFSRCGNAPGALSGNLTYRGYAEFIMNAAPIVMPEYGGLKHTGSMMLCDIVSERILTKDEAEHALGMVFPNVRAKRYLELRYADSMPKQYIFSYMALLKSIFYSPDLSEKYRKIFETDGEREYNELKASLYEKGAASRVNGKDVYAFGSELCGDALSAASVLSEEEKLYVSAFKEIFEKKKRICDN